MPTKTEYNQLALRLRQYIINHELQNELSHLLVEQEDNRIIMYFETPSNNQLKVVFGKYAIIYDLYDDFEQTIYNGIKHAIDEHKRSGGEEAEYFERILERINPSRSDDTLPLVKFFDRYRLVKLEKHYVESNVSMPRQFLSDYQDISELLPFADCDVKDSYVDDYETPRYDIIDKQTGKCVLANVYEMDVDDFIQSL